MKCENQNLIDMMTTVCSIQSGQPEAVLNLSMGRQSVKNNRDDWNWNIAVRKPIDDYCANDRAGVFKTENRAGDVGATSNSVTSIEQVDDMNSHDT